MSKARERLKAQKIEKLETLKKLGKSEVFTALSGEFQLSKAPEWQDIVSVFESLGIAEDLPQMEDVDPETSYIDHVLPFLSTEDLTELIKVYENPDVQAFHKVITAAVNQHMVEKNSDVIAVDEVTERLRQINAFVSHLQLGSIFAKLEVLSNPDTFRDAEVSDTEVIQGVEVEQEDVKQHHIAQVRVYMEMTESMPEETLLNALKVINESYAYKKEAVYQRGSELVMAAKNTRIFLAVETRIQEEADARAELS